MKMNLELVTALLRAERRQAEWSEHTIASYARNKWFEGKQAVNPYIVKNKQTRKFLKESNALFAAYEKALTDVGRLFYRSFDLNKELPNG